MLILNIFLATIQKHQGLFEGKSSTGTANLWVYCNEDSFWFSGCTKGDDPPVAIIAYEQESNFWNNWYITFCPQFYSSSYEIPFQQKISELKEANPNSNEMESYYGPPGTQAAIFFHETMHMSQLVTAPQAVDKVYGPLGAYNLAKNKNIETSLYNADSWTITALAIWAQQTFSLTSPPQPAEILNPSPPPPANEPSDEDVYPDVIYVDAAAVVPQGASAVPGGSPYFVDTTLWEIQNPAGGPPPPQSALSTIPAAPPTSVPLPTSVLPTAVPSSASAPPPAYATGNCSFHLIETQDCLSDAANLYAIVTLKDNNKSIIGQTPTNETNPLGEPINTSDSYNFNSDLSNPIVITGEHENDYVQFTYGGLSWTSRTTTGPATCSNGGWDPRDGPICGLRFGDQNAVNRIDCSFPC